MHNANQVDLSSFHPSGFVADSQAASVSALPVQLLGPETGGVAGFWGADWAGRGHQTPGEDYVSLEIGGGGLCVVRGGMLVTESGAHCYWK